MPTHQLGFDFARTAPPSPTQVDLAAARARLPRMGSPRATGPAAPEPDALPATELSAALELALRARCGVPLRLTVTDNRRTMLSLHKRKHLVEVRLHHMFLRAEAPIWDALSDYLFQSDRAAAGVIARYIEQHRRHIRRPEERALALATSGVHHDLHEIGREINQRYFEGQADVHLTWGRGQAAPPRARATRRSIKLGSYTSRDRLIRVHPALDAAFVPRFFVAYIVYHEMLHHVVPPTVQNGRRDLHGPAFQARERQFEQYHAALAWERDNLDKLLQNRGRRRKT
jgi:predicted metal-dependent hydrolase